MADRPCSHGPECDLPWSVHDWSYEAEVERNPDYANTPLTPCHHAAREFIGPGGIPGTDRTTCGKCGTALDPGFA